MRAAAAAAKTPRESALLYTSIAVILAGCVAVYRRLCTLSCTCVVTRR
jgi:hypothetical protein